MAGEVSLRRVERRVGRREAGTQPPPRREAGSDPWVAGTKSGQRPAWVRAHTRRAAHGHVTRAHVHTLVQTHANRKYTCITPACAQADLRARARTQANVLTCALALDTPSTHGLQNAHLCPYRARYELSTPGSSGTHSSRHANLYTHVDTTHTQHAREHWGRNTDSLNHREGALYTREGDTSMHSAVGRDRGAGVDLPAAVDSACESSS